MPGINISRREQLVPTETSLYKDFLTIVEEEVGKTRNPMFGQAKLDDLTIRIRLRLFYLLLERVGHES